VPRLSAAGGEAGELAIVLHTHMPYVEGFGTWPFGEEWLFEAVAGSYLPLLELLEGDGAGRVTLSLTPVLGDQLEAPGVTGRLLAFLRDVRAETHRIDIAGCRAGGEERMARELERSAAEYAAAAERVAALGEGGVGAALARHAGWTSLATHAVAPLLATDAGARLQLTSGIAAHRRRSGGWGGGLWLPECAYAGWLEPVLAEQGVRACCVDLTDVLGRGSPEQLRPSRGGHGPLLVPLDRELIELAWSDRGYPAAGAYRDYHHHTIHHHRAWANDGSHYDSARAAAAARAHAADFVARARARLEAGSLALGRPALAVVAFDTELLGHWWYEGVQWLAAVIGEAESSGLRLARLDDALARHDPFPRRSGLPVTSWGTPRTLETWSGTDVARFAWRARAAELRTVAAGPAAGERAARELLALQSSDWAFLAHRRLAGSYPEERAAGHAAALERALAGIDCRQPALRNLAPDLDLAALGRP